MSNKIIVSAQTTEDARNTIYNIPHILITLCLEGSSIPYIKESNHLISKILIKYKDNVDKDKSISKKQVCNIRNFIWNYRDQYRLILVRCNEDIDKASTLASIIDIKINKYNDIYEWVSKWKEVNDINLYVNINLHFKNYE